jgi:hypothetical protein
MIYKTKFMIYSILPKKRRYIWYGYGFLIFLQRQVQSFLLKREKLKEKKKTISLAGLKRKVFNKH